MHRALSVREERKEKRERGIEREWDKRKKNLALDYKKFMLEMLYYGPFFQPGT